MTDAASPSIAALLAALETISRGRPDRVLRLVGTLPAPEQDEPFELLIFRGFSSSVTPPHRLRPRPAGPAGIGLPHRSRTAGRAPQPQ